MFFPSGIHMFNPRPAPNSQISLVPSIRTSLVSLKYFHKRPIFLRQQSCNKKQYRDTVGATPPQ